MPRKPPFTFATFALHVQTTMIRAHPVETEIPAAMQDLLGRLGAPSDPSLSFRLRRLKTLFDEEALGGGAAGLA